jgi:hypothetical protein
MSVMVLIQKNQRNEKIRSLAFCNVLHRMSKQNRKSVYPNFLVNKIIHMTSHNRPTPYFAYKCTTLYPSNIPRQDHSIDLLGNRYEAMLETNHILDAVKFDQVC